MRHALRATVATALLALGCSADEPSSIRRYELADTLVVENLQPLVPDTLHPVEVRRYGMSDGPPEYLFSEIHSFAVDADGSVFVFDRHDGIRQYSADGKYQGIVAPRGQGPDEIGSASALGAGGPGRVGAMDPANRRFSLFGPDAPARSIRIADGHFPNADGVVVFHDDGSVWVEAPAVYPQERGIILHPRPVFLKFGAEGAFTDTVFTPAALAYHCPTLTSITHAAGFWEDDRDPFVPMLKWALGPDETFVVGCPATYRFYVFRPDGRILRVARAHRPVEVSQEERAFRDQLPMPKAEKTLPAYAKLLVPGGGRIWVWPRQPDVTAPIAPEVAEQFGVTHTWGLPWQGAFDVFSDEGDWLAVVKLPEHARYSGYPTEPNVVIRGDTLWAVEQDELDVQSVVRYVVPGLPERHR